MIEDTRKQLREARERLRASREALAASALSAAEPAGVAPVDEHENYWLPAPAAAEQPAEDDRYIPPHAPEWMQRLLRRIPVWARPPAVGATALVLLTGLPALLALPVVLKDPAQVAEAIQVVVLAVAAGAVGGLAFSLTRPSLEPLGRIGDYLTGIVCVAVYLGPLILLMPSHPDDPQTSPGADLMIFAILSVLFGLVVGHAWFYAARKRNAE